MCEQTVFELFPWITQDFVQGVIEKTEPNNCIEVKSFNASLAFQNGECFCSDMVSLKVIYIKNSNESEAAEKQKHFLLKIAIPTEEMKKISEECNFFEREAEVYANVLPALGKCFHSVGINDPIAPRYKNK